VTALFTQLPAVLVPFGWAYLLVTLLFNVFWWYQFVIAIGGFKRARRAPRAAPRFRFAVIVPAHNEEQVVGYLVEELDSQDYPRDRFDVFVSCDNCTDRTAEVARERGARALIRTDTTHAGKQWNLEWAFRQIPLRDYDAVVVFDADNIPEPDFLSSMNDFMAAHPEAEAIQGYLDSKNPDDSWVSRASALAYWYTNRFFQQARMPFGLSGQLGGTGAVIRIACLERIGWEPTSLADDLEFSTKLILAGGRVYWNDHARVYDEKPVTYGASHRQRSRWMRGHYSVLYRYGARVLAAFFRTRRLQYLDLFLYLAAPARLAVTYFLIIVGLSVYVAWVALSGLELSPGALLPGLSWAVIGIVLSAFNVVAGPSFRFDRFTLRYLPDAAIFYWFGLTLAPIVIVNAFRTREQGVWARTAHTRGLALRDLRHRRTDAPTTPPEGR